ncbi:hypothetical protein [Terrisporobacter petrolearius]|uniref:hypothetical protein n=1 Tax=Terrisporobacter petrolearius TaxID=1460447 RepID=UPI0031CC61FF
MKNRNMMINTLYFLIGVLIVLAMGELSEICIDLKQTSYDTIYDYLIMLVEFSGYIILGFWIGFKDIYDEFKKDGKWKLLNYRFVIIFIFAMISISSYFIYLDLTILNSLTLVLFALSGYILSQSLKKVEK